MRAWGIAVVAIALGLTFSACAALGFDFGEYSVADAAADGPVAHDATAGDGPSFDDAGQDGGAGEGSFVACVRITLDSGTTFCIDPYEVTNANYALFVAAMADAGSAAVTSATAKLPTFCASHIASAKDLEPAGWPPAKKLDSYPVLSVGWCQAAEYCGWAGKRLCGKLGDGGLIDTNQGPANLDPAVDEWSYACTNGRNLTYPYGFTLSCGTCNALCDGGGLDAAAPVGSFSDCRGVAPPFTQLFDMAGNAAEWENSYTASQPDATPVKYFAVRGGEYEMNARDVTCDWSFGSDESAALVGVRFIGFRCCAD